MATRWIWIWSPEICSKDAAEKAKALESQAFVSLWFSRPVEVLVRNTKEERHGRMLADCTRAGEPSLCSLCSELPGPCPHPGPLLTAVERGAIGGWRRERLGE